MTKPRLLPTRIGSLDIYHPTRIAGDASSRRYWRVQLEDSGSAVLCGYPPNQTATVRRDLEVLSWLSGRDLPVPRILGSELDAGWVLLQDLGTEDGEATLQKLPPEARLDMARTLIGPLLVLGHIPCPQLPRWNPPLDESGLRWELSGFELWVGGNTPECDAQPELGLWFDRLAKKIGRHPQRICHRDFHLNNLLMDHRGRLGVIDVQDVRLGPDTYDLASFLVDRAMPDLLGENNQEDLTEFWATETGAAPGWRRRLVESKLQRSLKVVATFVFLSRQGAIGYQKWIPSLARRTIRLAEEFDDASALAAILLNLASAGGCDVRHTWSS
ncbi:MAG: phosphotransferase [Thermoanaerobaculales bacterium]|nr:phosphotransferase [Thermoanaerobaculales bacterium]